MSAVNRQTSLSTELLHVLGQEESSSGGARSSGDFLAGEDTASTGSADTPNHENFARAKLFPLTGSGSTFTPTSNMPWFGGSLGGDQSSRRTLGATLPRGILATWDRPATYEEELEDRMGMLRMSTTTLYESLVAERKKVEALSDQLNARELSHRGAVERLREQNEQRFERLKGRARLLVARCEFLRNEKQLAEQRLSQAVETSARERQGMERKIDAFQEELDRLKNEKVDETRDLFLPVLRVTEDGDDLEEESEEKTKVKQEDSMVDCRSDNYRSGEHLRLLCEAAVARVAFLERWIAALSSSHSTTKEQQQQMETLHSLNGRSNSCPLVTAVGSHPLHLSHAESFHSNEYHLEELRCVLQVTKPCPSSPMQRSLSEDRTSEQTVIRMKSYPPTSSSVPSVKFFSNTRGAAVTMHGMHTAPVLPSTIKTSLHKLFRSGKSSPSDASISPSSSSSSQDKRISVPGRIETPSDEETPTFDGNFKRNRLRSSKKGKFSASLPAPAPAAKRHSSLPRRTELFRKFHYSGRHEKELRSVDFYPDLTRAALPQNSEPLTKQERVLGIRLDRASTESTRQAPDNSHSSSSTPYASDRLKELPNVRLNSQTDNESTESLPDRMEGFAAAEEEEETKTMKRNRSVHSTFGRLHQRRNGLANIGRIEQKAPNRSALDGFGKNLRHCLH